MKTGNVQLAVQMFNFLAGGDWPQISSMEEVGTLLSRLKEAGYDGVEWLNFMLEGDYMDVRELRSCMDRAGLKTCGMHFHAMGDDGWKSEVLKKNCSIAVERCKILESPYLIFAMSSPKSFGIEPSVRIPSGKPFEPDKFEYTPEEIDAWVSHMDESIDIMKDACQGTGIEVLYHNHADELLKNSKGQYFLDAIHCAKEVDVYWVAKGTDGKVSTALDYVRRTRDSIRMLHVKDGLDGSVFSGEMCGWGKGTYPISSIIDCAGELGLSWAVIENDAPQNFGTTGLEDAVQSMEFVHSPAFLTNRCN